MASMGFTLPVPAQVGQLSWFTCWRLGRMRWRVMTSTPKRLIFPTSMRALSAFRQSLMNFLRSSPFLPPASLLQAFIFSCWVIGAGGAPAFILSCCGVSFLSSAAEAIDSLSSTIRACS